MDSNKTDFIIVGDYGCPYYRINERFTLSGLKLIVPKNKSTCMLLIRDIIEILSTNSTATRSKNGKNSAKTFCCSGCSDGLIKFAPTFDRVALSQQTGLSREGEGEEQNKVRVAMANLRKTFPCFQTISEEGLRDIIACAEINSYPKGEVVLQRDQKGRDLYMIIAGEVGVFNDEDFCFASLGKGEVFGEMSLLSGRHVNATVKAVQRLKTLRLSGPDFDDLLVKHPSLRMALTQLITQRLSAKNIHSAAGLASGLIGRLSEIPAFELFQMFHENRKTGRIELGLSKGKAVLVYCNGEIVKAQYQDLRGVDAFFDILSETDGWFRFTPSMPHNAAPKKPIGAFMKILMEGLRMIDEKRLPVDPVNPV